MTELSHLSLLDNTSIISFCDKECINITSNKFKKILFQLLETKYKINPVSNSIYVKLDCNKIKNITLHTHILSTLTNGNPYMLYFTIIDGRNVALFIDRKKKENHTFPKIHVAEFQFSPEIYNETIMSGELIRDSNKNWFFLLDNIYLYQGKTLQDTNIITRFETIHTIMNKHFTPSNLDICPIQIKHLFQYKEIKYIFNDFMPKLSYICKGIVFYTMNPKYTNYCYELPRDEQIQIMSHEEIEKIVIKQCHDISISPPIIQYNEHKILSNVIQYNEHKILSNDTIVESQEELINNNDNNDDNNDNNDNNDNTKNDNKIKSYVVFKVLNTDKPDIYQLYHMEKKQLKYNSIAVIPNIKISKLMNHIFNDNQLDCKMRCIYSKIYERWSPLEITTENINTTSQISKIINNLKLLNT